MKKGLLSILSILSFGFGLMAQDQVEIYEEGQSTDLSSGNGSLNVVVSSAGEITRHFDIKNISGSQKSWKIVRHRINEIGTWSDYMCWEMCFDAAPMNYTTWASPTSLTIDDQSSERLDCYVTPDENNAGTVTYRYYVSENGTDYVDSVDLVVTFALNTASLTPDVAISVSPNPATETITVKASGSESGLVRIVDVLGNVVFEERYYGTKKVNVSNFRNGVYFVMVDPDNGKAVNKKIVVRH